MNDVTLNILGEEIPCTPEMRPVEQLLYLSRNPRVYSALADQALADEDVQTAIHKQMLKEPSVKKLKPRIVENGGLQEPIIVRHDTNEVIEGNSRLAVYKMLSEESSSDGKWDMIPCLVVSKLTKKQLASYLNEVHVEGKTPWLTYEKANHAYVMRYQDQMSEQEITKTLGISKLELQKRLSVIKMMEDAGDKNRNHFSHYNVLHRTKTISAELKENEELSKTLVKKIKSLNDKNSDNFTAQQLRDKLPTIIEKPRVLKQFVDGKKSLQDAFQDSKLSGPHQSLKVALNKVTDIEKAEVLKLSTAELNAAEIDVKRLLKETERIKNIIEKAKRGCNLL